MTSSTSVGIATERTIHAGGGRSEQVIVGCFEGEAPALGALGGPPAAAALEAVKRPGWAGRDGQVARSAVENGGRMVAVRGFGRSAALDVAGLSRWLDKALSAAAAEGWRKVLLVLPDHPVTAGRNGLRILGLLHLFGYRFEAFRSPRPGPESLKLRVAPPTGSHGAYRRALGVSRQVAAGAELARDLGNTPPNEASPAWMADRARALAGEQGLRIRVLGPGELARRGMGGILAVGGGSANPPRLVRLEWGRGRRTVALVGKGVTFDTGGISLKPPAAMDEMKYDKCGACAVLGIARATAALDLPIRFRAYLPLVENMPDGRSYRPGDIVRCYNGKTVEILNTDAEGRMILADALALAAKEGADDLLELSTLTGAAVVALGFHGAALYTPDDDLAGELLQAGASSGERLWRMPLWPEFRREMEGNHGDLKNVAGRWGGANHAAAFLSCFVGDLERWAHLDIAGTASVGSDQRGANGATGFGVSLVVDWILERVGRLRDPL